MYRQQISRKTSSLSKTNNASRMRSPNPTYAPMSNVVQRAQQDPKNVSGDELQQLEKAVGYRAMQKILAGESNWVPEYKGISTQIGSATMPSNQPIQAKLTIGQPNDKYEQEADRVAAQVVKQINAPATNQSTPERSLQSQKETEGNDQARGQKSVIQRASSTVGLQQEQIGGGEASAQLTSAINSARGGGQPLDPELQQSMGQAMGADFSGVRVHTDAQADRLNKSISARAFTTGQDVFFRHGEYQPENRGGQELLAHELTHVKQQQYGMGEVRRMSIDDLPMVRGMNVMSPHAVMLWKKEKEYDPWLEKFFNCYARSRYGDIGTQQLLIVEIWRDLIQSGLMNLPSKDNKDFKSLYNDMTQGEDHLLRIASIEKLVTLLDRIAFRAINDLKQAVATRWNKLEDQDKARYVSKAKGVSVTEVLSIIRSSRELPQEVRRNEGRR